MFTYDQRKTSEWMLNILRERLSKDAFLWIEDQLSKLNVDNNVSTLYKAFTAAPRFVGKGELIFKEGEDLSPERKGVSLKGFGTDHITRILLLIHFSSDNKNTYLKSIGQLFKAAEMNELVALYKALPFLPYPHDWANQCAEGIRSNIDLVLEAIMCDNPYASEYLSEQSWNQLVLKAIFTNKDLSRVIGLDKRANVSLAYAISDLAHERWAAGRDVNPFVWRLTVPFIDLKIFPDIIKLMKSGSDKEQQAAALTCYYCNYSPAKALLEARPTISEAIRQKKLTWDSISFMNKITV